MKQISITIALALLTTIANAQNIKGSHQVRANDEVKKQQVENRSESPDLIVVHGMTKLENIFGIK